MKKVMAIILSALLMLATVLVLAIATSIDALATGIVFCSFGFDTAKLVFSVLTIGGITFALSLFGVLAGKKLGERFKRGVLSEDAVYDLITEHRELMARLSGAVTATLEKNML